MNHQWNKDVCVNCGITRIKKEYKKLARTYSKLINGVWEDIPIYKYGVGYWYGLPDKKD